MFVVKPGRHDLGSSCFRYSATQSPSLLGSTFLVCSISVLGEAGSSEAVDRSVQRLAEFMCSIYMGGTHNLC